jgi:hypothetical protein
MMRFSGEGATRSVGDVAGFDGNYIWGSAAGTNAIRPYGIGKDAIGLRD